MENPDPSNHGNKKILRRNSNSLVSMSDTESTTSQVDSWHSPLRSDSPVRSDDPYFHHEIDNLAHKTSKSLSIEKFYSPGPSPGKSSLPASVSVPGAKGWRPWPHSASGNVDFPESPAAAAGRKGGEIPATGVLAINRMVRDEQPPVVKKVGAVGGSGGGSGGGRLEEGYGGEEGGGRRSRAEVADGLRRTQRSAAVSKAALVFRVFELMVCLISFSVMAADRTQGWSGDSFERYLEYRYCLAVNVIGFVYSGFQAYDLAYHLGTEKHVISHNLRYHFDFSMDQILAYLLMSASSSAATRVTDWILNWGKDEFTLMASASIAMSFLAFVAFALSSLVSGYNFCNRHST